VKSHRAIHFVGEFAGRCGGNFQTKSQSGMDILVPGSCQLEDMLIQNRLIREYLKGAHESLKSFLKITAQEGKEG
jgi:hypothetical protein